MSAPDRVPYEGLLAETLMLQCDDGGVLPVYLARPLGPGPHPGVIVVHHRHGYDWPSREIVRRFASEGFATIMPNLHHRIAPGLLAIEAATVVQDAGGVPDAQSIADLGTAFRYLRHQGYSSGRVGVIGYCSGGRQAYLAAAKVPFDATIVCYGGRIVAGPDDLDERTPVAPIDYTPDISSPVLGLFGLHDPRPSPEETTQIEAALKRHGKVHRFLTYEDAGHAFFSVDRPHYRPEAAAAGWSEVFSWFGR